MGINELVLKSLEDIGVPVYFLHKHNANDEDTYIIFNITSEDDRAFTDNENEIVRYRLLFKIFSKGDFTDTYNILVRKLKENGFMKGAASSDFNDELLLYQKSVYFTKILLNEDVIQTSFFM